MGKTKNN